MTPGVLAWLEHLDAVGTGQRARGNVGYRAMRAGLTQWVYLNQAGERLTKEEFDMRFATAEEQWAAWEAWKAVSETLTQAGRDALDVEIAARSAGAETREVRGGA